jgi:hypothetical protein
VAATLAQLRTRAQRRADRENSSFVATAEWTDLINEAGAELHDIVVLSFEDYLLTSGTVSIVAGTQSYALPSDFYKERGVDYTSGGTTYTLRPFLFRERNYYGGLGGLVSDDVANLRYQILGSNIRFVPSPAGSGTVTLWYIPTYTALSADADTISTAYAPGWEAFIVLGAAIKALKKEEADTSSLEMERQDLRQRIEGALKGRASGEPLRIVDVQVNDWEWR